MNALGVKLFGSAWYLQGSSTVTNRMKNVGYDAAGNLVEVNVGDKLTFGDYDGENQLRRIRAKASAGAPDTQDTVVSEYFYDGNGRRVKRKWGSVETFYIYGTEGELIAEYGSGSSGSTGGGSEFLFADHLGSTRLKIGSETKRGDYEPLGRVISRAGNGYGVDDALTQRFTGKERDAESGLDYFGARYYASTMGRMMSPDPVFISTDRIRDPQGLNLYAYARNNPLSITDPTGLDFYQTCTSTKDNGDTCQQVQNGSSKVWVQGSTDSGGNFTANRIGNNPDGSGGLVDLAHGNAAVNGTFDENGVHLNGAQGQFIDGSAQTNVNGTGIFSGIQGQFVSDCGGSCQGRAELVGSDQALAAMQGRLSQQGGLLSGLDLLSGAHNSGTQWKDANGYIHVILNGAGTLNAGKTEMHFEGHPTGVDVTKFVLHMVDTIRDATSGRAAAEKNRVLP